MTMFRTLQSYGVDAAPIFSEAGLGVTPAIQADQRVDSVRMQEVWKTAETVTRDPAFGLRFAQHLHPGSFQGLGFSWVASSTLYEAFLRLVRYYRIIATAGAVELEESPRTLSLVYHTPGDGKQAATVSMDAALATFVQLCRFTKDPDFGPLQVSFRHAEPGDCAPFDDFFGCSVIFSADRDALIFDRSMMDEPLPMANPELARANDEVIVAYLKRHDKSDISNSVRACIIECLPSGAPSQGMVAASLNMSPRTLQRKLQGIDQSFSELLEVIRKELAEQYLSAADRSIAEVAYLLGYSEPGNFARSFKRWCGVTPQQFQEAR